MKILVIHGDPESTDTKEMRTLKLPEDWEEWRKEMEAIKLEIENLKINEFTQRSFVRIA